MRVSTIKSHASSNGKEIITDSPPPTTINVLEECVASISNLQPVYPAYSSSAEVSEFKRIIQQMNCRLDAAFNKWYKVRQNDYSGVCSTSCEANNKIYYDEQIKIKKEYQIKLNNASKYYLTNQIKQEQIIQQNKETKMNQTEIAAVCWVTVASILILCVYSYFRRRHADDHKFTQAREDRQYNLQVKELELNQTIRLQQAELERYKTLELSKTQINNEHEVALKKIEFDKSIDARDFMLSVTKDEREYLLKQRELDIKENKSSPSFMDLVDSNKDVQLRLKK
jgi:hypothetical protein